jgi:hypothetical protein
MATMRKEERMYNEGYFNCDILFILTSKRYGKKKMGRPT